MIQSGASMSTITSRSSNIHHTFFEKERQALRKTARCQHARGGALIVYRDNGKEETQKYARKCEFKQDVEVAKLIEDTLEAYSHLL